MMMMKHFLTLHIALYVAACFSKVHLHRKVAVDGEKSCLPGVSIAKPLCTASDPNLADNLRSYFHLDYPKVPGSSAHTDSFA